MPDGIKIPNICVPAWLHFFSPVLEQERISSTVLTGRTRWTSNRIQPSNPSGAGRCFYSQLSGVAHGETAGVSMFIESDLNEGLQFVHRRDVLHPYLRRYILFSTCRLVLDKMIDHFGLEPEIATVGARSRREPSPGSRSYANQTQIAGSQVEVPRNFISASLR